MRADKLPDKVQVALRNYGNAEFDCGEWEADASELTWEQVLDSASAAKRVLVEAIVEAIIEAIEGHAEK